MGYTHQALNGSLAGFLMPRNSAKCNHTNAASVSITGLVDQWQ
ncbi:hypothetical protein LMG28727_04926 [Paraburkholderia kirstenboschensis]|nr:hypothetical protein LMG28727_04926 [Paraburkholderia kirstenboschensis]